MPWLVGCNYSPRTAINQLEMWQADSFDLATIDEELCWAASIGMNSVRVFLHDLVWQAEGAAFLDRIDQFLAVAERHGIGAMVVFFDSVWHPSPRADRQSDAKPGVHNSGWVQSPGVDVLREPARFDLLEDYVVAVVSRFAADARVQVWDLWNEPDNPNTLSYGPFDLGDRKGEVIAPLLKKAFAWARSAKPSQPLTSGVWLGDWSDASTLKPHEQLQIELSDVVSFHCYGKADDMQSRIAQLKRFDRPLLCTEYMARGTGSTFASILPVLKENRVAAYSWGLVAGRTQTHVPWDSWQNAYVTGEPPLWFHEVFRADGSAYRADEVDFIRSICLKNG